MIWPGVRFPDVVANLRLDQSWGYIGIGGALHRVEGAYFGTPNLDNSFHPNTENGWAVTAGGLVNLSANTAIGASAAWSKGAIGYVTKAGSWQMYGSEGNSTSVGVGWVVDGIFDGTANVAGARDIQLTNAWGANLAIEQKWNQRWKTSLYGGYTKIWYDDVATNIINSHLPGAAGTRPCVTPVAGSVWPPLAIPVGGAGNSCSPDFSFYQVGSRTEWNPAGGLTIGLDVTYTHLNTAYEGTSTGLYPANGSKVATNSITDQGIWSAILRAQHNF